MAAMERQADEEMLWLKRDKFPLWIYAGADGKLLNDLATRSSGPLYEPDGVNGWATICMRLGDRCRDQARSPAKSEGEKARLYNNAALYYGIARFPATETPLKQEAYSRQRSALSEGSHYFPFDFRREQIPYGDRDIAVNYYLPRPEKEIVRPEGVLLTGGADCTKEDLHYIAMQVVGAGMTCMTIDMPGTGENAWKLEPPGGNEVYSRAIKYLAGRGESDPSRVGMMGTGFGGYWTLVAASTSPEIKAAVNCGSPVHRAFSRDNVRKWPGYMKIPLARAMGIDLMEFNKALDALEEFPLFKREDLRRIACPLLSINGSDDPYVPIEDLFMIAEEGGVKQEEWVYREDGHCAPGQCGIWIPRSVAWLANKLGGPERIPRPDLATL
ncbi:alpha/beta hydrolase family protein [Methanocella arvoryzae]|uniref:Alpha/beta hydrolase n=1 Tax=Methanocella arvoryzae (strain DSM 22066 / NBRC 105507 / MRE50) TaxID=351160 RepID=Q0W8X7_METAR|nr:alpha/beta hydrolase [Methanocella arvoryzae]CAJ35149.1 conserved hypothetical protein [Methanocella arvoryzae MRE50]